MADEIRVRAEQEDWPQLRTFVEAFAAARKLSRDELSLLLVILEELHTNLVKYGYDDGAPRGATTVGLSVEDGHLVVDVRDDGRPFDPLSHQPGHIYFDAAKRPVGGLGLLLIQRLTDRASYRREEDQNWLRLTKRLEQTAAASG